MDPESTTTMGDGESATTERPFHIIKAVERTSAKLRICAASCRGCMSAIPSIFAIVVVVGVWWREVEQRMCGLVYVYNAGVSR